MRNGSGVVNSLSYILTYVTDLVVTISRYFSGKRIVFFSDPVSHHARYSWTDTRGRVHLVVIRVDLDPDENLLSYTVHGHTRAFDISEWEYLKTILDQECEAV